ncbi:VanZ family protein [Halorientalis salina]|uniref:VanZ family protein n=1 Tax=Halorientalis salina TaxID=2932266 RepID=UPI002118A126|nr:VanZ family protein [Halorientalis salina]
MASSLCPPESRWTTVGLVTLVLVLGSVLPSPLGRHPEFSRVGPDKALHFLGHASLAVTLTDALAADGIDRIGATAVAVSGSTALGLGLGFLQQFVPGRVPERADLVAGILGSVCGCVGWLFLSGNYRETSQ